MANDRPKERSIAPGSAELPDEPAAAPQPTWRRALPIALAIALMAFVLARVDWSTFADHLVALNYPAFLGFMTAFVLALLSADTLATVYVYRRTIPGLKLGDFWVVRGASYLPSMLNHHVGQAWITYFVAKAYGVDLRRMVGATLLVYVSWGGCVLALACVAVVAAGLPAAWLAIPLGAGVGYLILLGIKPARLARGRILGPLFEAGIGGHLVAMAVRAPHLIVLFLGTWLPFWFFGVEIPLTAALTYVPVIMVAVTLPITPQGFGTRDALAAAFFESFVVATTHDQRLAALAAVTATTAAALVVIEAVLGVVLLRRASALLPR
ncbi:MAG: flippase-like domain-containing protein [Deltaproteobacteria bacterium]|nr:flippase-like domain-containing protein [Deltaproteobacteria bacterium]